MFYERTLQDWATFSGPSTGQKLKQDLDLCPDAEDYDSCRVHLIVTEATNAELKLATAVSPEGPWTLFTSAYTAGEFFEELESNEGAVNMLERYLRWELTSTGTNWRICFTLLAIFQKLSDGGNMETRTVRVATAGRTSSRSTRR